MHVKINKHYMIVCKIIIQMNIVYLQIINVFLFNLMNINVMNIHKYQLIIVINFHHVYMINQTVNVKILKLINFLNQYKWIKIIIVV